VAKSDGSRRKLILAQLSDRAKQLGARGEIRRLPRLRNALLDILAEGRRKNIAHILVDADFTGIRDRLKEHRLLTGEAISVTSYIAKSFASAIASSASRRRRTSNEARLASSVSAPPRKGERMRWLTRGKSIGVKASSSSVSAASTSG